MLQRADEHYRLFLLRKCAFEPWRRLVARSKIDSARAYSNSRRYFLRVCFAYWRNGVSFCVHKREEESLFAVSHYYKNLMRHAWHKWRSTHERLRVRADAVAAQRLWRKKQEVMRHWYQRYRKRQNELAWKEQRAAAHAEKILKVRILNQWRSSLIVIRKERMTEERIRRTRARVNAWLDSGGL